MAVPKKKTQTTFEEAYGVDRQEELINLISDKSVYLPKHIGLEDLDTELFNHVVEQFKITVEGKDVPVFFLTKEKWADLSLTWQQSDQDGNIIMPFITVRRNEPPKQGTNENIKYRIAQNKTFIYSKVPTFENGVFGVDIYKTPQPIPIDITFEIRLFTHFMLDLNMINEKIQYKFASGQDYINVHGYYMPLKLDNVADESTMNDFDGQKFYCQAFTVILQGFIQDSNNFEVIKGLRRNKIDSRND